MRFMIEVTPDELVLFFLITGISLIGSVWFISLLTHTWRIYSGRRTRMRCRLCGYKFLNKEKQKLVACPHCGGLNEPGGRRRY